MSEWLAPAVFLVQLALLALFGGLLWQIGRREERLPPLNLPTSRRQKRGGAR